MNTALDPMAPSNTWRKAIDVASQITGWYRLHALARGNLVAFGAQLKSPSRIALGRGVVIQSNTILHGGGKSWCRNSGHIRLGDGVRIGPGCMIYGAGGVDLAQHVHLGPNVKLMSQAGRHSPSRETANPDYRFDPIVIGPGSWIGAGAVVLGGARIGRSVTVAPNSVVSGRIPDFAVVVGNPGRVMFFNSGANDD